ncbi:hypothetical protein NFJ02_04g116320 [Pycnococcus provasolii]
MSSAVPQPTVRDVRELQREYQRVRDANCTLEAENCALNERYDYRLEEFVKRLKSLVGNDSAVAWKNASRTYDVSKACASSFREIMDLRDQRQGRGVVHGQDEMLEEACRKLISSRVLRPREERGFISLTGQPLNEEAHMYYETGSTRLTRFTNVLKKWTKRSQPKLPTFPKKVIFAQEEAPKAGGRAKS